MFFKWQDLGQTFSEAQSIINLVTEFLVAYSFNILGAILILIVGFIVAHQVAKLVSGLMEKKNIDITLTKFTGSIVRLVVLMFVAIIAMSNFGIEINPFIAAIGGLMFGASFALQGPLSNYAAGITIIVARPFVVGDTITIQGQYGIVEEVKLGYTILHDEDGVKIMIPNKKVVGEILHNSKQFRIVENSVGISYSDDPEKAIQIVEQTLVAMPEVTSEPKPLIGIEDFGESSVRIGIRFWVPTEQYFESMYKTNLAIYKALGDANISIPFPQRDVHLIQTESAS